MICRITNRQVAVDVIENFEGSVIVAAPNPWILTNIARIAVIQRRLRSNNDTPFHQFQ